jgi:large subunit ribosomal protein L9
VERGFDLDRKRILLEHPIKELGAHDVVLQIHRNISVALPVRVVRPGEDPDAIAPEFAAEGRLEIPDEDLAAETEKVAEVVEDNKIRTEVHEAEERPETGTVAE